MGGRGKLIETRDRWVEGRHRLTMRADHWSVVTEVTALHDLLLLPLFPGQQLDVTLTWDRPGPKSACVTGCVRVEHRSQTPQLQVNTKLSKTPPQSPHLPNRLSRPVTTAPPNQ